MAPPRRVHHGPIARYLSPRFSDALRLAAELHADQKRKKDDRVVPYVSHLLATAALVLEDDGDEDQAIAALLHDAVEDRDLTEERITTEFGAEVARIVLACSDTAGGTDGEKPPYVPRKSHHIDKLRELGADTPVLRVTAADKLHNCRDILADLDEHGRDTLARFHGGVDGTCWYYGQMAELLREALPASRLTGPLCVAVERLHEVAGLAYPAPRPPT